MLRKKIEIKEVFAKTKVNSLWNGYRLETDDVELNKVFDNIKKNNQLLKIFKAQEVQNTIYGSSYAFFDIEENGAIHIGLWDQDNENESAKIDGLVEYAITGRRTLTEPSGRPVVILECRTENETLIQPLTPATKTTLLKRFQIKTPDYVLKKSKKQTIKHNYGVISAKQFLNLNVIDRNVNEMFLPDNANVAFLEPLINRTLNYIYEEQELDKTRVFGQFSQQDLDRMNERNAITNDMIFELRRQGILTGNEDLDDLYAASAKPAMSRFVWSTPDSGNNIQIQTSNFDLQKLTLGLNALIEVYFELSGLSFSLGKTSQAVKSKEEVLAQQRTTIETIKTYKALREEDYTDFFNRIIIAVLGKEVADNLKGKWSFTIISNVINAENQDIDTISKALASNIISKKQAIQQWNADLTDAEINKLMLELESQETQEWNKTQDKQENEEEDTQTNTEDLGKKETVIEEK